MLAIRGILFISVLGVVIFQPVRGFNFLNFLLKPNILEKNPAVLMLDSMQQIMTGSDTFDRKLYGNITECLGTLGSNAIKTHRRMYRAIVEYWNTRGAEGDRWGQNGNGYFECNKTQINYQGMEVYEPCNAAATTALFHTMLELCAKRKEDDDDDDDDDDGLNMPDDALDAIMKNLFTISVTSFAGHASNTKMFVNQTLILADVTYYTAHQALMSKLTDSPILINLSTRSRLLTGLDLSNNLESIYSTRSVHQWQRSISDIDRPNYYLSINALVSTIALMTMPPKLADKALQFTFKMYPMKENDRKFLLQTFVPKLKEVLNGFQVDQSTRKSLIDNTLGFHTKAGKAILMHERDIDTGGMTSKRIYNKFNTVFLPFMNKKVNERNTFDYYNEDFQMLRNVYPGDWWCNPLYSHAKWHVESAISMLDLILLYDQVYGILDDRE